MSGELDRESSGSQTPNAPSGSQASSESEDSQSTGVVKHSVVIAGHRTSVSLEAPFWDSLKHIAAAEGVSLAALVARVDMGRGKANLSSALRVFVLGRVGRKHHPADG